MENKKITKARYNFQKALNKLIDKYKEKGVDIKSVEVEWGAN